MNKDINKQLQTVIGNLIGKDYLQGVNDYFEPTLNDVLLAIETKVSEYEIIIFGELLHIGWYEKPNKEGYYDKLYINLSKSIFNQKDETKLAIIKLLE